MNLYVNIHTHTADKNTNICINNLNFDSKLTTSVRENLFFSCGLHPWDVETFDFEVVKMQLVEKIAGKQIIAIGEIGLDKAVACNFVLQKNVFTKQLKLAQQFSKPVIIHCVKAYSEILEIIKQEKITVPLIFHQFMANFETYKQLLKYNSYFSFGKNLFLEKAKIFSYFDEIPISRIFFETDDSEILVEKVYLKASEMLNLDIEILKTQIVTNFDTIFGKKNTDFINI